MRIISTSRRAVSALYTRKRIHEAVTNYAEMFADAVIDGKPIKGYFDDLARINFVSLYSYDETDCIPCFVLKASEVDSVSYESLARYCVDKFCKPPINDFEVVNFIDFDNNEVAMEREIYDAEIGSHRKISLDTKFSFAEVREKGIKKLAGIN